MKTKLLFLVLLIAILSCKKSSDNESSTDSEKIKGEVKTVVNTIFQGCEEVNAGMVLETCQNTADFVYLFNGRTLTYLDFSESLSAVYDTLLNQDVNLVQEKYAILDNSTVLYTTNCTFLQHFKDGHSNLIDPVAMLFIFKKTGDKWKWIYAVESYN